VLARRARATAFSDHGGSSPGGAASRSRSPASASVGLGRPFSPAAARLLSQASAAKAQQRPGSARGTGGSAVYPDVTPGVASLYNRASSPSQLLPSPPPVAASTPARAALAAALQQRNRSQLAHSAYAPVFPEYDEQDDMGGEARPSSNRYALLLAKDYSYTDEILFEVFYCQKPSLMLTKA